MPSILKQLIDSKKAVSMIAGVIVAIAARYGFELDAGSLAAVVSPFVIYIYSQGRVDEAKHAVEVAHIQNK